MHCRICGSSKSSEIIYAKEMMFGLGDEFEYYRCADCGCLQIISIPQDISRYYPDNYYSYNSIPEPRGLQKWLSRQRLRYVFFRKNLIGAAISVFVKDTVLSYGRMLNLKLDMDVLDIGCGNGSLLHRMARAGFKNLTGIDKFISESSNCNCVNLVKGEIDNLSGSLFDVIMIHHSLEHMPDQHSVFESLKTLLKLRGKILIRVPVIGYAFEIYRANWVQLDAPRHFYLHSLRSMQTLADQHGFSIDSITFDSTAFQFTGSIRYSNNSPLSEPYPFSKQELADYSAKARQLNREQRGDQACFIISLR